MRTAEAQARSIEAERALIFCSSPLSRLAFVPLEMMCGDPGGWERTNQSTALSVYSTTMSLSLSLRIGWELCGATLVSSRGVDKGRGREGGGPFIRTAISSLSLSLSAYLSTPFSCALTRLSPPPPPKLSPHHPKRKCLPHLHTSYPLHIWRQESYAQRLGMGKVPRTKTSITNNQIHTASSTSSTRGRQTVF